jgi:putative transposase
MSLNPELRERLWPFLGGIANQNGITPRCIGGVADQHNFSWQQGYGAFSVSVSQLPETIDYIQNQVEHHRTRIFQEEYVTFLKRHELSFDDKYLWD